MLKCILNVFLFLLLGLVMSSCLYEMPDEENPRAVPQTNNPNEIKSSESTMPTEIKY